MDPASFRNFATSMINGSGIRAKLRRGTPPVDRVCQAAIIDWTPREAALRIDGSRRALISAHDPVTGKLLVAPNYELDKLVFAGVIYNIPMPDRGPRVDGSPGFFDLEVTYDSRDV